MTTYAPLRIGGTTVRSKLSAYAAWLTGVVLALASAVFALARTYQ